MSKFTDAFRPLLDVIRSRAEWGLILGVSAQVVEQWASERAFPSARQLRSIMSLVTEDERTPKKLLDAFNTMADMPSRLTTKHWRTVTPSVGSFMMRPLIIGFCRTLQTLPYEQQEEILLFAAAVCRERRNHPEQGLLALASQAKTTPV